MSRKPRTRFDEIPLFDAEGGTPGLTPSALAQAFRQAKHGGTPLSDALVQMFADAEQLAHAMKEAVQQITAQRALADDDVPRDGRGRPRHGVMSARTLRTMEPFRAVPDPVFAVALAALVADPEVRVRAVVLHDWALWVSRDPAAAASGDVLRGAWPPEPPGADDSQEDAHAA